MDFKRTKDKNRLIAVCEDGKVLIDRRVYEQKLGTLLTCKTRQEVFDLATSCHEYLESNYNEEINSPAMIN